MRNEKPQKKVRFLLMRAVALALVCALFLTSCTRCTLFEEPRQGAEKELENGQHLKKDAIVIVKMKTNKGDIDIELNQEKAPLTVENFIGYVKSGHFDGTIFHRVIPGFMVQGGGFDASMEQKATNKPIKIESNNGLKNERGTLAMARTNDPDSATAQFFINLVDNSFLDYVNDAKPGYAVFGRVTAGMDVVDEIAKVKTGNKGMHADVPMEVVSIESATVVD